MVRVLRAPVPEDAPHHIPTSTVLLDGSLLLTSWVEGRAATRLGVLDLRTGGWSVVAGVRGMLRAAQPGIDGHALLLTDQGLWEIDLVALSVTRSLRTKIGKGNDELRAESDGTVVVAGSASTMESVVDRSTLTVVRRRRRAPLRLTLPTAAARRAGIVRVLHEGSGVLAGGTATRDAAPQRLLVVSIEDGTEIASVEQPTGLSSVHVVHDGIVAAAPDLGRSRSLTAVLGVFGPPPPGTVPGALDDLVVAATASAESLLTRASRRKPVRTVHRDRRLEPGAHLHDLRVERVTLDGCSVARTAEADSRPTISRVHVTDLELQSSTLSGAVFEDVTVDGLRAVHGSGFLFGCELRRVTLRGRVRGLVLATGLDDPDPATEALYARCHQERLADPEWMLDLTEATGDLTIRGYPARFVRRNPELQAVVTAEAVADGAWRSVDPGRSALRVALHELVRSGWEDVILVADPHGAHADDDLRYIRDLRDLGVATRD